MIRSVPHQDAVSDAELKRLWDERADIESFLRALRQRGAWQIESIKAVRQLSHGSLAEAKEIVHFSATWADMRETAEALHESAYASLLQAGYIERRDESELMRVAS
jgi:ribosomal protein L7/L12